MPKAPRLRDPVLWIFALGVALRVFMSFRIHFGTDDIAIYHQALDLYLDGHLSPVGARVVYSNTQIPGALQSLLMGLPLFLSGGMPQGPAVFLALWNSAALAVIYVWVRELFPRLERLPLAGWVFLCPWSLAFIELWNPSFLPLFSALFFFALWRLEQKPGNHWAALTAAACVMACLQLHLSFVVLAALLGLWILRHWRNASWMGLVGGVALGGLTLVPYFAHQWASAQGNPFLAGNVVLHLDRVLQWPMICLRFLAFSTGELTRFISLPGKGFGGTLSLVTEHAWLIPLYVLTLLGTVALIVLGVCGLGRMIRYWRLVPHTPDEFIATLVLDALLATCVGFLVSIKDPSAHTFWILFPLSFLPVAAKLASRPMQKRRRIPAWGIATYLAASVLFLLLAYPKVPTNSPLRDAVSLARGHYPQPIDTLPGSAEARAAAEALYRVWSRR
ncbi:MAG: hypothetical protein AB7P04_13645 [Bacteriovoracia bacterium]